MTFFVTVPGGLLITFIGYLWTLPTGSYDVISIGISLVGVFVVFIGIHDLVIGKVWVNT